MWISKDDLESIKARQQGLENKFSKLREVVTGERDRPSFTDPRLMVLSHSSQERSLVDKVKYLQLECGERNDEIKKMKGLLSELIDYVYGEENAT